jgi:Uma2 family endonuclease
MATPIAPDVDRSEPEVKRRRASYEEYLEVAGETRIVEWVDGEIVEYMPPSVLHQKLTWFFLKLLSAFVDELDLGIVGAGPMEVKLWAGGPSREPDVFFLTEDNLPSLEEQRYSGAPDLVIEVVSPGSVREDRVRKFTEYEQAGVREYWLVDPRPNQRTVECYVRDAAGIFQPVEAGEDGRLYSSVLTFNGARFWLHVGWPWQEPLPKVSALVRQIFASDERFSRREE